MIHLPTHYPSWLSAERRWLGLILTLSLAAHILTFFVFRLRQDRPRVLPSRPSTVTFFDASEDSTGNASSHEGWLRWRDPAHLALPPEALPEPETIHKALAGRFPERRNTTAEQPMPFPPSASPVTLSASLPPLDRQASQAALNIQPLPTHQDIANPPALGGSRFSLGGDLAKRGLLTAPELPQPESALLPKPTILQAGIDAQGGMVFVSIDESSGSPDLDQTALRLVYRWKFKPAPADTPLQSGRILIHWDIKAPRS